MKIRVFKGLFVVLALIAGIARVRAAEVTWTNVNGGNWSDGINWNTASAPGPTDIAVITNAGNYIVALDVDATVGGLILGSTDIGSTQTLLVNGQALSLAGQTLVNSNGCLNFANGSVAFTGILTNYGTVLCSNMNLSGQSGPEIDNYGLWETSGSCYFEGGDSNGTTFNNFGVFRQSGSAGDQGELDSQVAFNNAGLVDVQTGRLFIQNGTGSGTFNMADGGSILFNNYILTGNPVFTGPGWVDGSLNGDNAVLHGALNTDTLTLAGTLTIASNTVLSSISPPGDYDCTFAGVLTNYGTVTWSGGYLYGGGNTLIANYGLWEIATDHQFQGGGGTTFDNFGTYRQSSISYFFGGFDSTVVFNNIGLVDIQAGRFFIQNGTGSGTFNTDDGASILFSNYVLSGNPTFTGSGWVDGYLNGDNAMVHGALISDTITLAGTLTIASNAVFGSLSPAIDPSAYVYFTGILTNYGTVTWSGSDLYGQSSPQIDNYGLWVDPTDNTFHGGSPGITTFNNFGTFRKSGGVPGSGATSFDAATSFNNPGLVDIQVGQLQLDGSFSPADGTLNFAIGGLTQFGSLAITGNTALGGTLSVNLTNGYLPAIDDSFALIHYGSESGAFSALNLPHLASGVYWQTDYGSTAFTLTAAVVPPFSLATPVRTDEHTISLAWTTLPGESYQVQYATNLAPPVWINLGNPITATNDTMSASDIINLDPQRFYRVILQ